MILGNLIHCKNNDMKGKVKEIVNGYLVKVDDNEVK